MFLFLLVLGYLTVLAKQISLFNGLTRMHVDALIDDRHCEIQRERLPGVLRVLHIQSVNIEVKVVETTQLKHKAAIDGH